MARTDFKEDDLIGDFLPDVSVRRITLEDTTIEMQDPAEERPANAMAATIDIVIEDVLNEELRQITSQLVDDDLTRDQGRRVRTSDSVLDEAMKVCVIAVTSKVADDEIKSILTRSGQGSLQQRMANSQFIRNSEVRRSMVRYTGQDTPKTPVGNDGVFLGVPFAAPEIPNISLMPSGQLFSGSPASRVSGFLSSNRDVLDVELEQEGVSVDQIVVMSIRQVFENLASSRDDVFFFQDATRVTEGGDLISATRDHLKEYDINNDIVYKYPKTYTMAIPEARHLSFYCFTCMDFGVFDIDLNMGDLMFLNHLYGKLSYNKVISKGKLEPYKMVLLDINNTPWTGPYHIMRNGTYMKGRFHEEDRIDQSEYLDPIMVPNYQVQDFRSFQRWEKDRYLPESTPSFLQLNAALRHVREKRATQINAHIDVEHNPVSGEVGLEFVIDQEQIFVNNSKYGPMYEKLPNSVKYTIMRPRKYFKLVEAKILRRRVTNRNIGSNILGFAAKDVFDREEVDTLIASSGEGFSDRVGMDWSSFRISFVHAGIPTENDLMTPVNSANGSIEDEDIDQIRFAVSTYVSPWMTRPTNSSLPTTFGGVPPFPFYRRIIASDTSMSNVTDGVYQYGFELVYEDGLEKYLIEKLREIQTQRKNLQEYYNECLIPVKTETFFSRSGLLGQDLVMGDTETRGNYNHITKRFEADFVVSARENYNFAEMARTYFDVSNIVYADALSKVMDPDNGVDRTIGGFAIDEIENLLSPENSRPEQISKILDAFLNMESLIQDIVDIDLVKDSSNCQFHPSSQSGNKRPPKFIKVGRWFGGSEENFVRARDRELPVTSLALPEDFTRVAPLGEGIDVLSDASQVDVQVEGIEEINRPRTRRRRRRGRRRHRRVASSEQIRDMWFMEENKFGLGDIIDSDAPVAFSFNNLNIGGEVITFETPGAQESDQLVLPAFNQSSAAEAPAKSKLDTLDKAVEFVVGGDEQERRVLPEWREKVPRHGSPDPFHHFRSSVNSAIERFSNSAVTERAVDAILGSDTSIRDATRFLCVDMPIEEPPVAEPIDFGESPIEFEETNRAALLTSFVEGNLGPRNPEIEQEELIMVSNVIENMVQMDAVREANMRIGQEEEEFEAFEFNPPVQIKKLSRPGVTKLGADAVSASKTLYGTLKIVKRREGFEKDLSGRPMLDKPIYKTMKVKDVKEGLPPGKYKLENYQSSKLGIMSSKALAGEKFFEIEADTSKVRNIKEMKKQETVSENFQKQVRQSAKRQELRQDNKKMKENNKNRTQERTQAPAITPRRSGTRKSPTTTPSSPGFRPMGPTPTTPRSGGGSGGGKGGY